MRVLKLEVSMAKKAPLSYLPLLDSVMLIRLGFKSFHLSYRQILTFLTVKEVCLKVVQMKRM